MLLLLMNFKKKTTYFWLFRFDFLDLTFWLFITFFFLHLEHPNAHHRLAVSQSMNSLSYLHILTGLRLWPLHECVCACPNVLVFVLVLVLVLCPCPCPSVSLLFHVFLPHPDPLQQHWFINLYSRPKHLWFLQTLTLSATTRNNIFIWVSSWLN